MLSIAHFLVPSSFSSKNPRRMELFLWEIRRLFFFYVLLRSTLFFHLLRLTWNRTFRPGFHFISLRGWGHFFSKLVSYLFLESIFFEVSSLRRCAVLSSFAGHSHKIDTRNRNSITCFFCGIVPVVKALLENYSCWLLKGSNR